MSRALIRAKACRRQTILPENYNVFQTPPDIGRLSIGASILQTRPGKCFINHIFAYLSTLCSTLPLIPAMSSTIEHHTCPSAPRSPTISHHYEHLLPRPKQSRLS